MEAAGTFSSVLPMMETLLFDVFTVVATYENGFSIITPGPGKIGVVFALALKNAI
jgi:hypothetical protein